MKKIVDAIDPQRINRLPDKTVTLLSSGKYLEQEFKVERIELREYVTDRSEKSGFYSIITLFIETDKGSIEKIYDEGYKGSHLIEEVAAFLTSHLVLPNIIRQSVGILRSSIEIDVSEVIKRRSEILIKTMKSKGFLSNKKVEEAIKKVPRHLFVPSKYLEEAYEDIPLPTKKFQTISQPSVVARMTEWLDVQEGNKVLEIGCGSGWQSAIISQLVGNEVVYSVERVHDLVDFAKENHRKAGITRVKVIEGDGTFGHVDKAPYDRIIITAACPSIPNPLLEQLSINGLLVAPVGEFMQSMTLLKKTKGGIVQLKKQEGYLFAPFIGKFS